jgi:hypothetical protein
MCDHASVGVLIRREDRDADLGPRWLMLDRPGGNGVASVAGHLNDTHGFRTEATVARAEVAQQVGLTVTELHRVSGGWREDPCGRPTESGNEIGHVWQVYRAEVTGPLPASAVARGAQWMTEEKLQELADRTTAYARERISHTDWAARPGLNPVWVMWLVDARVIHVSAAALDDIECLAELGPARCAECATCTDLDRHYDQDLDRLVWLCSACHAGAFAGALAVH